MSKRLLKCKEPGCKNKQSQGWKRWCSKCGKALCYPCWKFQDRKSGLCSACQVPPPKDGSPDEEWRRRQRAWFYCRSNHSPRVFVCRNGHDMRGRNLLMDGVKRYCRICRNAYKKEKMRVYYAKKKAERDGG